jgi:hypothetical protein
MKKFVAALLAATTMVAALAVPAFGSNGNTGALLENRGTLTCVNNNAYHTYRNHDTVSVYTNYCEGY